MLCPLYDSLTFIFPVQRSYDPVLFIICSMLLYIIPGTVLTEILNGDLQISVFYIYMNVWTHICIRSCTSLSAPAWIYTGIILYADLSTRLVDPLDRSCFISTGRAAEFRILYVINITSFIHLLPGSSFRSPDNSIL